MNKEQFFKAIDGVDDKLLKGVFDADEEVKLTEAETEHGAAYRPDYRPRRRFFAAAAASLAVVVGAGFAAKALSTPNSGNSNGVVLSSGPAAFGPADLIEDPGKIDDPENAENPYWIKLEHGFDDMKHLGIHCKELKGTNYIRVPDGMFEEYDFTNVGEYIGQSLLSIYEGNEYYTFPENEDFMVILMDGRYVPFIDEDVCEDYGVPLIDYSDECIITTKEEGHFSFEIACALKSADTVEELEQLLAECDPDHRIDGFVIYENKKDFLTEMKIEDPSGVFTVGMCIQVYWDNYSSHTDRKIANSRFREFVYPEPEAEPSRDNCYPEDNSAAPDFTE